MVIIGEAEVREIKLERSPRDAIIIVEPAQIAENGSLVGQKGIDAVGFAECEPFALSRGDRVPGARLAGASNDSGDHGAAPRRAPSGFSMNGGA